MNEIETQAQTLRKQWYARTQNLLVPWEWTTEQERQAWRSLASGGFFPEIKMGIDVFATTHRRREQGVKRKQNAL